MLFFSVSRTWSLFRLKLEQSLYSQKANHNIMAKQTIVVFGATGKQGGSVVKALLKDPKTAAKFRVKAVTRDVTKESAKALSSLGAELVSVSSVAQLTFFTQC
jgi:NmrA-like family